MNIVIFGITGDLSNKKLLPALSALEQKGVFPDGLKVIGFARSQKAGVNVVGDYASREDVSRLGTVIDQEKETIFYFALPPNVYGDLLLSLTHSGLVKKGETNKKILIEKPFGVNKKDALRLFDIVEKYFDYSQIYFVDHYGGKKEVRDFEILDPDKTSSIDVSIYEQTDVSNRAGFYDDVGAINDVGQNHLLYMLSASLGKNNRAYIIKNLKIADNTIVVGQYDGFQNESGVKIGSRTETFFSIEAQIDADPFKNIKINLSSGKALDKTIAKINNVVLSSGTSAYENIFEDAINSKRETFLSKEEILYCWDFAEKLKQESAKCDLIIYSKNSLPEMIGSDINTIL